MLGPPPTGLKTMRDGPNATAPSPPEPSRAAGSFFGHHQSFGGWDRPTRKRTLAMTARSRSGPSKWQEGGFPPLLLGARVLMPAASSPL